MRYRESKIDRELTRWFANDYSCALLKRIELVYGDIRGINPLSLDFEYPITAIAGKNGVGKSTILALACCAYHNVKAGYKNPKRKNSYYTFSDFFVQHKSEMSPQGIVIRYWIAHDKWKKTEKFPDGIGLGYQARKKGHGGKWNDYDSRVNRTVAFLGIERIVPHVERSQSRSYSKVFRASRLKGWENKVKDVVGYILGRDYSDFCFYEYSKYSMPVVKVGEVVYSGLNMGAGENALFEIFSTMYSCGRGGLIVMDEIELGLHAEAQSRFIQKLKEICLEIKSQVVCTTHSREIFDCLPPSARIFVEDINGKTIVSPGISGDFAFAKLSGITGNEMCIYVEDLIAKAILDFALSSATRKRVDIKVIGSASCIARQMAANYLLDNESLVFAVFDGDQHEKEKDNLRTALKSLEKDDAAFEGWFKSRIQYLPGKTWPERWIFESALTCPSDVAPVFRTDEDNLINYLKNSLRSGKHSEFFALASQTGYSVKVCLDLLAHTVCSRCIDEFVVLEQAIIQALKA